MRIGGSWLRVTLLSALCLESHLEQKKAESFSRMVLSARILIQASNSMGSLGFLGLAGLTMVDVVAVVGVDTTSCWFSINSIIGSNGEDSQTICGGFFLENLKSPPSGSGLL